MTNNISARVVYLLLCLALPYRVDSQSFVLADSIPISYPTTVSIDRQNNIYIADRKGDLKQYAHGELLQIFSPQKAGTISLVEAWNPLKIFLFFADFQEYIFLDRFLTGSQRYSTPGSSRFSGIATLSADNNLWLVDYVNFGLKKYNISFGQFTINTSFDLILNPQNYEITFIREYQNLLFISDKNSGILVFDNLGNYLRKIPARGIEYFSFKEDELYYVKGNRLTLINIYNTTERTFNLPEEALFALLYNDHLALITKKSLKTFKIP